MRTYVYIIGMSLTLLAASACRKESYDPAVFRDQAIRFSGNRVTKGFLEADGLYKTGTQVKVFDFLTGFDGEVNGTTYTPSDQIKYIDDVVEFLGGSNTWPYQTVSHEYRWTKSGTHRFFGWLNKDQAYNNDEGLTTAGFFGSSPSLNENTLVMTTPTYSWTTASPQYDFVYAKSAVLRDASQNDYSDIELPMKHLFTAVSLTFENKSTGTPVQVTGLSTLYEGRDLFLHKGSATVDYSGNGEAIPSYSLSGDVENPFFSASNISGTTIFSGEKYDILSGVKLNNADGSAVYGASPSFYMTWPLTVSQISPGPSGEDVFGDKFYTDEDKVLALTYQAGGLAPETIRVPFPGKPWLAGTRNHMNIEFTEKAISITAETLPWDYNEQTISFNDESVVVPDGGKLSIDGMSNLSDNATIYLTTLTPEVTCKLHISSLKGSTLIITKVGADPSFFTLDPGTLTITGNQLSFKVKSSNLNTGGVERTCQLTFSVQLPDGREIDADSEIMADDHNYTFSRQ